jgi:hypothetical protein
MMNKILLFSFIFISIIDLSCELAQEPYTLFEDYGEYTFLEINHRIYGQHIDGTHGDLGIDFAPYMFDKTTGELRIYNIIANGKNQIKKSDLICAHQTELKREVGYGSAGSVQGIIKYPGIIAIKDFGVDRTDTITIIGQTKAGDVRIVFRGSDTIITTNSFVVFEHEYISNTNFGKFIIKDSIFIINQGKLKREKLTF